MNRSNTIEIQFTNIEPQMVRAKDLAKILSAVEDMISSAVASKNVGIKKEDVKVSLTEIKDKCIDITFTHNYSNEVHGEFQNIGKAIANNCLNTMQKEVRESLNVFSDFNKKYATTTKFIDTSAVERKVLAELREILEKKSISIRGGTTLYGTVYKVGGLSSPKVGIRLSNGEDINCEASEKIAERLGALLYKPVGVQGVAEWEPVAFKILKFKITEILSYSPVPIGKAIGELSEKYGQDFSDVDPIKFLKEIR